MSESRPTGNYALFIRDAMLKHTDALNEGLFGTYEEQAFLEKEYRAKIDKWQADAAKLPDAGKLPDTDPTTTVNGKGSGWGTAGLATGLMVAAAALKMIAAAGAATSWTGIGAIVAVVAVALLCIVFGALAMAGQLGGTYDTVKGHVNYDPGKQSEATSQVQLDQTEVQRLQNMMSKLTQTDVSPTMDARSHNATLIQGTIQWLKSMIWQQSAA